jgi:methylenetetrahydrofolate reductase (NADPH)
MNRVELDAVEPPPLVSFEFSPPKTPEMEDQLWRAIRRLEPLNPSFVSVTYGAGGSTRDRTHTTVKRIVEETHLVPAAHLTCVGSSRAEIDGIVRGYWDAGVRHVVALRGDMPEANARYCPHPSGYQSTPELIAGIKAVAPFEISVSCSPEVHPESTSLESDIDLLARKIDAGASRAIGNFCFRTDAIVRLRDRVAARGLNIPVVPGLMPTTNFKGVLRMAARNGASVPQRLRRLYDGLDEDVQSRKAIAAAVLVQQVDELRAHGFERFHFYTLNQADLTFAACRLLGLPATPEKVSA